MENKLESAFWFGVWTVALTIIVALLLCLLVLGLTIFWSKYWFISLMKGKEEAEKWLILKQREADLEAAVYAVPFRLP